MRAFSTILLLTLFTATAAPARGALAAAEFGAGVSVTPSCTLHVAGEGWTGSCGTLIEGERTSLSAASAAGVSSGTWKKGDAPNSVWAGTVVVGEYPETPIEIEVYADGSGVLRTVFGWFPIARFGAKTDSLHFEVDTTREVPPSGVDREIIERARAILSAETAWNRADDRQCPADARTWSIYCSLVKASIEVAGAFHHRRPALQVVREIVDERTAGRPYEHRLMDYNNDPSTGLTEIRSLFAEALRRIEMVAQRGSTSVAESNHSTQESD